MELFDIRPNFRVDKKDELLEELHGIKWTGGREALCNDCLPARSSVTIFFQLCENHRFLLVLMGCLLWQDC